MRRTRLPNRFGSIRYLGAGRRNAYAVNVTIAVGEEEAEAATGAEGTAKTAEAAAGTEGTAKAAVKRATRRKALCYTASWEEGYQVLVLFHAGVITADESADVIREKLRRINGGEESMEDPHDKMVRYAKKMLVDLELIRSGAEVDTEDEAGHTFRQVYDSFIDHRFGPNASQKRKKSTKNGYNSAWLKLAPFYDLTLDQVSVDDLETCVNLVAKRGYSKTTVQRLVTLIHQLYKYAYDRGYCEGRHGLGVEMPAAKEEVHHQDFTDEEIGKLWETYRTSADAFVVDTVRMILIMCYSGFRIKEYETLEFVDGEVPYFRGGLKTNAGKNRIVPVHSKILPLVRECGGVFLCGKKNGQFRRDMKKVLVQIGVDEPGGCHKKCYGKPAADADTHGSYKNADIQDRYENADTHGSYKSADVHGRYESADIHDSYKSSDTYGSYENADIQDSYKTADARGGSGSDSAESRRYHTPHSTRHTFSRLCESYDVKEADRKRMMGHSLKGDVTNGVYGHRSVEELRAELEKIEKKIMSFS